MKRIALILLITVSLLSSCSKPLTQLEQIQSSDTLRVITRSSPTTYYKRGTEYAGLELDLAKRFAEHLGVQLKISVADNLATLLQQVEQGHVDIAAAGLTVTDDREDLVRFGPVYQEVRQQLVYRQGNRKPEDLTEVDDGILEVVADSSHVEQLKHLKQEVPELEWSENTVLDSNHLLELVQLELIDYTVADSNEITASRNLFPELRVAFNLSDPQPLAWALALSDDESLYNEVITFFEQLTASGSMDRLIEKYYGHIRRFDYVDTRAIYRKIATHLPRYRPYFEKAAAQHDLDWRLLAAISYQESHWDPKAVSSTGVKGLMMLTRDTAKEMNIDDRTDPKQSIEAGTGYLMSLRDRLPDRIKDSDKLWLALASYNVGLGHVEDARVITQQQGKNPDLWSDVKDHLPLLSKKKWYSKTRYGYARGREPVRYIENIRRYYDILLHELGNNDKMPAASPEDIGNAPPLPSAL